MVEDRATVLLPHGFMLSFIVPAYNEELELPSTLAAIHAAVRDSEPYEIIVVNDGSTDATATIALSYDARVFTINRRQIAASRNAGGRQAQGEVLIFVDADTRITPRHVPAVLSALREGYVGGGARVDVNEEIPRWGRVFLRVFGALYFAGNFGAGAFLFTTRSVFDRIGGFDEQCFAAEEYYFTLALKKLGRFRLIAEPVMTSGRKLRMHSPRQILGALAAIILRGKGAIRSRDKLHLWYSGMRETEVRKRPAGAASN